MNPPPPMYDWTVRLRDQPDVRTVRAAYYRTDSVAQLVEFKDDHGKIVYTVGSWCVVEIRQGSGEPREVTR